jgi:hypothetical protein
MITNKTRRVINNGVEIDVTYNESNDPNKWKLIHDGTRVIHCVETDSIVRTIHQIFVGTKGQCIAEAIRLNLTNQLDLINNNRSIVKPKVKLTLPTRP